MLKAPMSDAAPLVSIVTPTYNHEAYLGECIESALAQTYPHWEMIVVDDGSTDGTREVAGRYRDPRVRLVAQANKGIGRLGETYNAALAVARGELVAILEGDDYWPRYKLAQQVPSFEDESVVLSSGFTAIVEDGECLGLTPVHPPEGAEARNAPVGAAAGVMMDPERLTYTFPVSTMIRRAALDRIGGFVQPDYLPLVDYPTFLRLTAEGEFRFLPDVLGTWRRHGASTTRSRFPAILDGVYRYTAEFLAENRPALALSDAELNALSDKWQTFEATRSTLRGRMLNAQGRFPQAIRAFRETALYDRPRGNRVGTALGATLSRLHLPTEPMFRAMGHAPIRSLVERTGGDVLVAESDLDRPRPVHRWRFGSE